MKEDLKIELLMILGGAIAMGTAMVNSGVGEALGNWIQLGLPFLEPWSLLLSLMLLTVLLTSFVTNVAAVSIIFPVVFALSPVFDMSLSVVFLAIAFSASAAFITPVSYQTNLMVQAPGGYTNKDFLKYGFPMLLLYFMVVLGYLYLIS
jgi:di/tricarboxylate transporter